ncbi:Putative cyclin-A3-1 [Linum perenne]
MADQENCSRLTRAARKRAAAAMTPADEECAPFQQQKRNRVVLGELPQLSNVGPISVDLTSGGRPDKRKAKAKANPKPKRKSKAKVVVKSEKEQLPTPELIPPTVDAGSEDRDGLTDDPQMCTPYVSDIYEYLHKLEAEPKRRPLPDYIEKIQTEVSPNMRGILVDWLVEVAEEYKLVSDTLYLTITYIDRFLSLTPSNKQRLQLLGVSSMLIASKYEEITPPNVDDFCYITDNTYSKDEVVKMEADILKRLKFELGTPTIKTFLRKINRVAQEDYISQNLQLEFMGCYLAELSLLDYNCVKFLPSVVAASVMFLARFIINPKMHPWNSTLHEYSGYSPAELKECVLILHDLYLSRRGGGLHSVRDKYKQHKFKCVAVVPSPPEIPASFFEVVEQKMKEPRFIEVIDIED